MDLFIFLVKNVLIIGITELVFNFNNIGTVIDPNMFKFGSGTLQNGQAESIVSGNSTAARVEVDPPLWTRCSASCGEGIQKQICKTDDAMCDPTGTKRCFEMFCPSYLSWPRIHFSGQFEADVTTVNNIRCNYVNSQFSATSMKDGFPILSRKGKVYELGTVSWNPDGSGRYHINAKVTSSCEAPGNCSTQNAIVGREMKETSMVAMVDLDTDWQFAAELYGMKLKIQGILEAKYKTSTIQQPKPRGNFLMATIKSVLIDIKWIDESYKKMFKNATSLSISSVMDQYFEGTNVGRITGTIGHTSPDDPQQTIASRRMLPVNKWRMKSSVPFFVNRSHKFITLDMSSSINCSEEGKFNVSALGELDLALDVGHHISYCRNHEYQDCVRSSPATLIPLTQGGAISQRMTEESGWFNIFGGIMDISLEHLDSETWDLLKSTKVVITRKSPNQREPEVILSETDGGINLGVMGTIVKRLNPGDEYETTAFVSAFGRPLSGVELTLGVVKGSFADMDCGWDICNRTLGEPRTALDVTTKSAATDINGLITFKVKASDPGNVRGCGLDGQLYPMEIQLVYDNMTYVEGGLLRQLEEYADYFDYYLATLPSAIAVYNDVPEIECPTWKDLEDIFLLYHNLYPVMWKHGIIDLHSYEHVKERARMLKYSMFETDFDDARFMPISRDLSRSKLKLIKNWMDCGMEEREKPEPPTCDEKKMKIQRQELEKLLQRAVTLELTTIPPYYTAWLSLQTEYGRNKEIANVIKSVFVDEMLHMALAANILNSINGTVDLTSYSNLPIYPTSLGFGSFYKIAPDLTVTLGPMSRGIVKDVFLPIEEPAGNDQRKILDQVATLWEKMAPRDSSDAMQRFVDDLKDDEDERVRSREKERKDEFTKRRESDENEECELTGPHGHGEPAKPHNCGQSMVDGESRTQEGMDWKDINDFAAQGLFDMSNTDVTSIGAFYTAIALNLAFLESCHQMRGEQETLFTGAVSHQVNISHWYRPKDEQLENSQESDIDFPIFAVKDLKTALEAIVAIIYEGEGGSDCSPYINEGENSENLSHYHRYKEIVHGKKLIRAREPNEFESASCIRFNDDCQPMIGDEKYCFVGDEVPFYEDGVWPIVKNAKDSMYPEGSEVKRLNNEFNALYTQLLQCLESTLQGKPNDMKKCMSEMRYMTIIGKKLVQTPVGIFSNGVTSSEYGAPTWTYRRNDQNTLGLPIREPFERLY